MAADEQAAYAAGDQRIGNGKYLAIAQLAIHQAKIDSQLQRRRERLFAIGDRSADEPPSAPQGRGYEAAQRSMIFDHQDTRSRVGISQ